MKTIKTTFSTTGYLVYLKATIFGIITSAVSIITLLLIFASVLKMTGALPHDLLIWFDMVACAVSCYIGGYTASRITRHNALLSGLLCGLSVFTILLIAGFIFKEELTHISLIKLSVILLASVIGSIKGVNKKQKLSIK